MRENKFLIIGYGNMGALHSEILFSLVDNCKFDIVDTKKIKLIGKHLNQIEFENITDVNSYNGVIISTHSDSHLHYIKKLKNFNKLIFVEKPLVTNEKELNYFQKEGNKNIFCGLIETHNELFSIAKDNMKSEPFHIQVERISPPLNSERIKDDVDFDLTIHDVSVALEFFINNKDIISSDSTNIKKNKNGLYEMNTLNVYTKNCLLNFSSSRLGQKKIRKWKIFTIDEQVEIDLIKKEVTVTRKNKKISLKKNQLVQDFNEKIIIDTKINPGHKQMVEYLKCLESNSKEYKYNNLLDAHDILLISK